MSCCICFRLVVLSLSFILYLRFQVMRQLTQWIHFRIRCLSKVLVLFPWLWIRSQKQRNRHLLLLHRLIQLMKSSFPSESNSQDPVDRTFKNVLSIHSYSLHYNMSKIHCRIKSWISRLHLSTLLGQKFVTFMTTVVGNHNNNKRKCLVKVQSTQSTLCYLSKWVTYLSSKTQVQGSKRDRAPAIVMISKREGIRKRILPCNSSVFMIKYTFDSLWRNRFVVHTDHSTLWLSLSTSRQLTSNVFVVFDKSIDNRFVLKYLYLKRKREV